jgi:hypothetical protein
MSGEDDKDRRFSGKLVVRCTFHRGDCRNLAFFRPLHNLGLVQTTNMEIFEILENPCRIRWIKEGTDEEFMIYKRANGSCCKDGPSYSPSRAR